MLIPVEQIQKGDRFLHDGRQHWMALADAEETRVLESDDEPIITVVVQFVDGGVGTRAWDPGMTIEVERGGK